MRAMSKMSTRFICQNRVRPIRDLLFDCFIFLYFRNFYPNIGYSSSPGVTVFLRAHTQFVFTLFQTGQTGLVLNHCSLFQAFG